MNKSDKIVPFDDNGIKRAARLVKVGGIIVFPTDTVYGLGCNPMNEKAVNRLFLTKRREGKPIPILCSSIEHAEAIVHFNDLARQLAKVYWPGPLTIVLPAKRVFPEAIHQGTNMIGVRIPALARCIELIEMCGGYLTGTSANISGEPSCRTANEALNSIGEMVDLILDGGKLEGIPSTVIMVKGERIEVLRKGPVRVMD